jgi:tRNA(Ile)-lysidine synthase
MVLADILHASGYKVIIAHCDFNLRAESPLDWVLVLDFCTRLSLISESIIFDTKSYASEHKISIEMAARELRYQWFQEVKKKHSASYIATAHHLDDSTETILLNICKGTGFRGLRGIPSINQDIIRPLSQCTKEEILKYAMDNGIRYNEDSTNATNDYQRNQIRNQVVPVLKSINPQLHLHFASLSFIASDVQEMVDFFIDQNFKEDWSKGIIDIEKLKSFSFAKLILFELLHTLGFNSSQVNDIYSSIDAQSGKVFTSSTYVLIKDRSAFIFKKNEGVKPEVNFIINYTSDQSLEMNDIKISSRLVSNLASPKSNVVFIDIQKVKFPLSIRSKKIGDVFYPTGMTGKKKLSDYFNDQKMSLFDKEKVLVLVDDNDEIIWVINHRPDRRSIADSSTSNILEIKVE